MFPNVFKTYLPTKSIKKMFVLTHIRTFLESVGFKLGMSDDRKLTIFSVQPTTIQKIFETNSSFHMKQRTTGKVHFLFLSSFLLVLTKFSFWEEDWALGHNSNKF